MAWKRIKEALAVLLIGDGLIGVLEPRRHTALWSAGPRRPYRDAMRKLERNSMLARAAGVGLIGVGFWLVSRQKA